MHLRIGPLVITDATWLVELEAKIDAVKASGAALIAKTDVLIAGEYDLVVDAENRTRIAEARLAECVELLGSQQAEIVRLESMLRHPVSQPRPEDES